MPDDLREGIERAAFQHGRTLTTEINLRLRASLQAAASTSAPAVYGAPPPPQAITTSEPVSCDLSATDRAMLEVFRRMPPEKQLALLSLFR